MERLLIHIPGEFFDAGSVYDFVAGGVSEFEICGIPDNLDLLAGDEYITGVAFIGSGTFTGEMLSVVPEPSTWALMLVGFGGLGVVALRRAGKGRRATTAV